MSLEKKKPIDYFTSTPKKNKSRPLIQVAIREHIIAGILLLIKD